jgi:hypothetical protein
LKELRSWPDDPFDLPVAQPPFQGGHAVHRPALSPMTASELRLFPDPEGVLDLNAEVTHRRLHRGKAWATVDGVAMPQQIVKAAHCPGRSVMTESQRIPEWNGSSSALQRSNWHSPNPVLSDLAIRRPGMRESVRRDSPIATVVDILAQTASEQCPLGCDLSGP